jgi:hypothetical protein
MFQSQRLRYEPQVVVDYLSPHGPQVTDIRGMLIQSRLKLLKDAGYFEDYLARLHQSYQDSILNALASSWVPVETGIAHFNALDEMQLSDAQISHMAEPLGAGLFESLFATLVRAARNSGAEIGVWFGLKQSDRVFGRMYQGGGCKVSQIGPKDAIVEINGLPYANSRCFRVAHCGFLRGVFSVTTKACVCKVIPQAESRPDRLVVSLSWV